MRELDKVIGYENIKNELYRIIDIIRNPEKYKVLGVKIPRGIMFEGKPGIGKTLMAKSFIEESGRKAFIIRKDRPDGAFVDHIRETFAEAAEEAPSIILLDDIDKFANEDDMHCDAEEYVTVQTCIDEYKDNDVFIVATCNDYRSMPRSLVRRGRFDKTFHMDFPKNEDAKLIIEFYLKDKTVSDDIDVDEIVRYSEGHSCADLETVVNEAGIIAGFENKERISQDDLRKACLRNFWGIKKDYSRDCPAGLARRKAVHEAGHAVIIEHFYPGEVSFITIERVHDALVLRKRDERHFETFRDHEIGILIDLAGKAATELILGEIDMGTNSDLRAAYDATAWLLDGLAAYDFQSWCHGEETAERVFDHLDDVKGAEVARYYMKTKQILMQDRAFLEALADVVADKKTVTYKDIAPIREKFIADQKNAA